MRFDETTLYTWPRRDDSFSDSLRPNGSALTFQNRPIMLDLVNPFRAVRHVVDPLRHVMPLDPRTIKKKGPGVRPARPQPAPEMGRLLQRSGDVVKVGAQLRADTLHGGDDRDRDARCNQAILNGRGS